jgi:fermentation-respiration switch protein FrsA (DUF1100 family)
MYCFQRSFLYFPFGNIKNIPNNFKEISIKIDDKNFIYGWYSPAQKGQKTILYFHGNAGNLSGRSKRLEKFSSQYGILVISYRGYPKSKGKSTEKNFFEDADYALKYLKSLNINSEDIIIFGESIGSGVAVNLASKHNFATIVLEAPFTSVLEVAKETYWFLPVSLILKDRFESNKLVSKITSPVLIFHANRDNVVPFSQGQELYELFSSRKKFITIDGDFHVGIDADFIIKHLNEFLVSSVKEDRLISPKIIDI